MNRLRALIRNIFGFSRTETNGFLILLPLMVLVLFSQPIYRWITSSKPENFSNTQRHLDSLVATWEEEKQNDSTIAENPEASLFRFDPNTATEEELLALGFPGNIAQRIINYRAKGGRFSIKADLSKIYGLDTSFYRELYPFIALPEKHEATASTLAENPSGKETKTVRFDLNLADTTQLKSIYGIGSVLSKKIVRYRTSLGGFISMEQLSEVWGLDSIVIKRLSEKAFIQPGFELTRIHINHADEKTLAAHPYIRTKMAKAIVTNRFQHGNFKTIDDLKKIVILKASDLNKLEPYLNFDE